jgi:hypothetical protein
VDTGRIALPHFKIVYFTVVISKLLFGLQILGMGTRTGRRSTWKRRYEKQVRVQICLFCFGYTLFARGDVIFFRRVRSIPLLATDDLRVRVHDVRHRHHHPVVRAAGRRVRLLARLDRQGRDQCHSTCW